MTVRDPILIVGGGLGGLTAALALARRGLATRVLEGAPEFGAIGYGIQFGPNVFRVFDSIGLTEEVLAVADSPAAVLILDAAQRQRAGQDADWSTAARTVQISLNHRSPH
jgi:3-hydroxybenzoate 6-monooxygenase